MSKSICFRIDSISTTEFATIEDVKVSDDMVALKTGVGFKVDLKNNFIGVEPKFVFLSQENPFIIISVLCNFFLDEASINQFKQESRFVIPKDFVTHLAVIAVGTTRGVLHAKTENTTFNKYIIPTINLTEIITNDLVVDM